MLTPREQRGLSSIELMIGVGILAVLLASGVPAFSAWIQGMQVRSTAESVLSGLQLARAEALKRNAPVRLTLGDSNGSPVWRVGCANVAADCPAQIQARPFEGGSGARLGADATPLASPLPASAFAVALAAGAGLPAGVTFDGFGRVPASAAGTDIARIDIMNGASGVARRLVIAVGGGQLRLCDPAVSTAAGAQGC
jgi:type IV fimbrial biogenesis protein FimT